MIKKSYVIPNGANKNNVISQINKPSYSSADGKISECSDTETNYFFILFLSFILHSECRKKQNLKKIVEIAVVFESPKNKIKSLVKYIMCTSKWCY